MNTRTLTRSRFASLLGLFTLSGVTVFSTLAACSSPTPAPPVVKTEPVGKTEPVDDESVRSNYPARVEADASASKICEAFQALPRTRKAECCQQPTGFLLTGECTRVLSGAIQASAIVVDDQRASACAAAMAERFDGCGWVGEWSRELPAACTDILAGQLDDGATCGSSLECKAGLTCHGVSPTDMGVCGAPGKAGAVCGRGIDPVATYVGADAMRAHPECEGFCANQRCRALAKPGERCVSDAHCGEGSICAGEGESKVCRVGAHHRAATTGDLEERCASRT